MTAYSDPLEINQTQVKESVPQLPDTPVVIAKKSASMTMVRASTPPARKQTLNEGSRGLSAFLGIGIGINVIMAILFAWWFSSEWRKQNKLRRLKHDD